MAIGKSYKLYGVQWVSVIGDWLQLGRFTHNISGLSLAMHEHGGCYMYIEVSIMRPLCLVVQCFNYMHLLG